MVTLSQDDKRWNKKYEHLFNKDIIHKANVYSEHGEDNIIECIFSQIKPQNKMFVDVGAAGEKSSNTYKLIQEGWRGVLIESDEKKAIEIKESFRTNKNIKVIHAFVTPTNLDELLSFPWDEEIIDFMSIDVDSFEYEIWKNLKEIKPNLVCIEINQFETDFKKIGYDPSFSLGKREGYGGATVGLMNRLAKEKEYDYLCLDVSNAFYIRKEFGNGLQR